MQKAGGNHQYLARAGLMVHQVLFAFAEFYQDRPFDYPPQFSSSLMDLKRESLSRFQEQQFGIEV